MLQKFTQNRLNRLCFVCAGLCRKKFSLAASVFLDRLSNYYLVIILRSCSKLLPQNNLLYLCFVCAAKKLVCVASVFLDIKRIFTDHSEVTQPPTCSKFPLIVSFVCASLLPVVFFVVTTVFFTYLK